LPEKAKGFTKYSSPLEFILSNSKGWDGVCMLSSSFPSASSGQALLSVMVNLSNHRGVLHLSIFEQPVKRLFY